MKDSRLYLISAPILGAIISLSSCVNTDTIEPAEQQDATSRIVLNLSAPDEIATRASSDVKLRFVAKLYNGTSELNHTNLIRQEMILGEKSIANVENQMIFDVPADKDYIIYVFADYIPQSFQPSQEGLYDDYYYDTHNSDYSVSMLATPGNKKTEDVSPEFFNNDNYDCFSNVYNVGRKTEERVDIDLELNRAVAKVRFLDTSEKAGQFNVSVSSTTYLKEHTIREDSDDRLNAFAPTDSSKSLTIESQKDFSDSGDQEVLFFYTFANKKHVDAYLPNLTFTLSDGSNSTSINADKIPVQMNHITSVKGKFVQGLYPDDSGNSGIDPTKGYIYLNLSINSEDWSTLDSSWSK